MAIRGHLPYISQGANGGAINADINKQCHGWTGVVPGNQYHVMPSPRVYAIYWDEYFDRHRDAVEMMDRFFREILRGGYMRQLRQYGVREAHFVGSVVIVPEPQHRPPLQLSDKYIEDQLLAWIDEVRVKARPAPDEKNLLYIILTPSTTSIGEFICGYHRSGRYDHPPGDDNLFWAAIQDWHYYSPKLPGSGRELADSCTWGISHEMVEAFTDRDGQGYHTPDGCEIGDICECAVGAPIMKVEVKEGQGEAEGWWVETYWDNENQSCYPLHVVPRGTAPVGGYHGANGGANGGKHGANGGKAG